MPAFETTIRTTLLADSTLNTKVDGDRVRPLHLVQGEGKVFPSIVYAMGDKNDPGASHSGPSEWTIITFDVTSIGRSYAQCEALAADVRRILNGFSGTVDGIYIHWQKFDDESDIEQPPEPGAEKPVYVRTQTFRAMYRIA